MGKEKCTLTEKSEKSALPEKILATRMRKGPPRLTMGRAPRMVNPTLIILIRVGGPMAKFWRVIAGERQTGTKRAADQPAMVGFAGECDSWTSSDGGCHSDTAQGQNQSLMHTSFFRHDCFVAVVLRRLLTR